MHKNRISYTHINIIVNEYYSVGRVKVSSIGRSGKLILSSVVHNLIYDNADIQIEIRTFSILIFDIERRLLCEEGVGATLLAEAHMRHLILSSVIPILIYDNVDLQMEIRTFSILILDIS